MLTRGAALLAALLVFACLLVGVPTASAVTHAASGFDPDVAITAVSPTVAAPGKPVTITGSLTAGSRALTAPVLTASLGTTDLDTVSSVRSWNAGTSQVLTRNRASTRPGSLNAGGFEQFTLTIPAEALALRYSNANLPLSISLSNGVGGVPLSTWRTTLSFVRTAPAVPMHVTWLVPLMLPADSALFGPTGSARTAAWENAIGTGSRIDTMLRALAGQPVTWVIDPAVIAPPAAADRNVPAATSSAAPTGTSSSSTRGSSGASGSSSSAGSTSSGAPTSSGSRSSTTSPSDSSGTSGTSTDPAATLAAQLRTRLASLPSYQSVMWTPYDDPDVSALATSGTRGEQLMREEVGRSLPSDMAAVSSTSVAWPASGVDATVLRTITNAWSQKHRAAPVVILPKEAASDAGDITGTAERSATGTSGLLLYDQQLSELVGAATGDIGLRTQEFLAQSLAVYEERPATSRSLAIVVPRSAGAAASQLASIISAARKAPWLADRSGAQAVRIARSAAPDTLRSQRTAVTFPAPRTTAITQAFLTRIGTQRRQLSGLNSLLVNSGDVISDRLRLVDNLGSTRWRGYTAGATHSAQYSAAGLASLLSLVSVSTSPVNFFTDRGALSINVVNKLNRPVRNVRVVLLPRAIQLKVRRQAPPISLAAGGLGIVRPEVAAAGSGSVPVDAVIETANGVELGAPRGMKANLQVNVRPTATWIYWALGAVAGLILIGGVVRSIRRGPRAEHDVAPQPGSAPPRAATPGDAIVASTPSPTAAAPRPGDETATTDHRAGEDPHE
ncbi:DUF6049 family protein [Allobranchiibius sp. GilTou38]|uniref:DUF6049 family protein n=1 Tax=Allobranchiibius sp. GilTou38 TaxID=2815210 RepID=UPI001FB6387F|nr:DUF6049 family protein [Allobranchiibius sp. GilTou38]